jgi:ribosomal protein RSM22 (predicted rRNA methylase)
MRLLLVKCQICSAWFGGKRNHCPHCAACRVDLGNGSVIHLDSFSGRVIVSGLNRYHFKSQALAIAQELSKGLPIRS